MNIRERRVLHSLIMATVLFGCSTFSIAQDDGLTIYPTTATKSVAVAVSANGPGRWVCVSKEPWGFHPLIVLNEGSMAILEAKPGDYGLLFFPPGDGQPVTRMITLGGTPTPPKPPTPPGPVVPDGHKGLSKLTYQWAMDTVKPEFRGAALTLSVNYLAVSNGLRADPPTIINAVAAFDEIRRLNKEKLDQPTMDAWAVWSQRLGNWLSEDWDKEVAYTREEAAQVIGAVAGGLSYVK